MPCDVDTVCIYHLTPALIHARLQLSRDYHQLGRVDDPQRSRHVGDINLRYSDSNGRLLESRLNNRVIGLLLDEVCQIETVVGVAGGEAKFNAILGAVRDRWSIHW